MYYDELMQLVQAALDPQSYSCLHVTQKINHLMQQGDYRLLEMGIYAAITENAPAYFKDYAALLVKNFLTCKNPYTYAQNTYVYYSLDSSFKNATISQLILLMSSNPYDQIFYGLAAMINASTSNEQRYIVCELVYHASVSSTFLILQVFEKLRNSALVPYVPEFCLTCLRNFYQVFQPHMFYQGIKLSVRVLRRSKDYIPPAMHAEINSMLYLLLQYSVQSQQTEFIQEILEFYVDIVGIFDLLNYTVDQQAFITQLINLCFMYSSYYMQQYKMLFSILELLKKTFSLPVYKAIYQSYYPFAVVENCLLPILNNDVYYGDQMLSELFVVVYELLDIIISNAEGLFYVQYLYYVNSMGLISFIDTDVRILQSQQQLSALRHMILLTPMLKSGKNLDYFFISYMTRLATFILDNAATMNSYLLYYSFDMISYLLGKSSGKHEIFNKVVELLPGIMRDFHWRSIKNVFIAFYETDSRHFENRVTQIYSNVIRGKSQIDTSAAMVLIDQVLPVLEKSVTSENLFYLMSTVCDAFSQIQYHFMRDMDVSQLPYLQVITESVNLPVFFIVRSEMHLSNEETQVFDGLASRVQDLLVCYTRQDKYYFENEVCQLLEIMSIIQKKSDYRIRNTQTLNQLCLHVINDLPYSESTSYFLDLLVKLPEFISTVYIEQRIIGIINDPSTPHKLQNAVLIYFMELYDSYYKQLPAEVMAYIDRFLAQIDLFDFSDKYYFLILQSVVLILQKTVQMFCKSQDQAVFAGYQMLKNSLNRPSLVEEPQEYLFVSGYEAAVNCFTCCYHQFKQNNNQAKQQMVLGYVNELGKDWLSIREILRQMQDMQQHLSQFEGQFSAILRQAQ